MDQKKLYEDFQYADLATLNQERDKLPRLYTFLKRYVEKTLSAAQTSRYALALFSSGGILLDLFAREGCMPEQLQADGIRASSIWMDMGYNAVSEGLVGKKSLASIGEEHTHPLLKPYALYFAPISMLSPYEPYEPTEQCGLAIICPAEDAWPEYLTMVRGAAHDMMITLQFNNIATMYYERSGKGVLSIDNMMSPTRDSLITYYNQELLNMLGARVAPADIYYKPVKPLIDPLPANQELWDIVREHRTINNYPLTITTRGKQVECIASTDPFNQPSINAHGVTFYLTTQQKMTARLSARMANGAIKTFEDIIGRDQQLESIIRRARQMAITSSNIMILGESGTGKDVFAQAIHNAGTRRDKPFIALNCGAMPRDLIESELFGYENGAFTGARKNGNIGKFELASGGTIFLDEIGEMPLELQAKLLRLVEQKQLMRLGGTKLIQVDVRIIAATNANIEEMIQLKQFRADLYYRLSTMKLHLIPLRERKGDIIPLAEHFIRRISERIGKPNIMRFSDKAKVLLERLDWPGNVRELQNLVECIVQLYPGDMILPEYILDNISHYDRLAFSPASFSSDMASVPMEKALPGEASQPEGTPAPRSRKHLTAQDILDALERCGNHRSDAAKYLGISRRTLYRKMEELGIPTKQETP